jgi:hypothetical protein
LLAHQYVASVRYLLGDAAAAAAEGAGLLPTDQPLNGYLAIGAAETPPSLTHPELWDLTAEKVAVAVVADPSRLAAFVPCVTAGPFDDACYDDLAADFGRMLFRRPATSEDRAWVTGIAKKAREWASGDFMTGIAYALRAMLQAPSFLYLAEIGEPDADVVSPDGPRRKLGPHELASRLSFFLVDATPDEELLDAADAKKLDEAGLRAQAERLVAKPEAKSAVHRRFREFLYLAEALSAQKSPETYPDFDDNVRAAMVEEAERLLEDLFFVRDADARELFTADYTFVNDALAKIYGVSAPPAGAWKKVSWPAEQARAGFLASGAFLARASHAVTTSPTRRGVFIKDRVLCETVPPPDPDVNPSLPQPKPGEPPKTTKELVQAHQKEQRCKDCHAKFDPFGFAYEHFDAIGRYRTTDAGEPVDSTGEIEGFGKFASPRDVANILLADEKKRLSHCLMLHYFRGSLGHLETKGEEPALEKLHAAFEGASFSLKELLVETTVNPAFLYVAEQGSMP